MITKKGKGYDKAEADGKYHSVSPFDPQQGIVKKASQAELT